MKELIFLTDYKGLFGSKWNAESYRGGMDKGLLQKYAGAAGYSVSFKNLPEGLSYSRELKDRQGYFLYTSSEDKNFHYKDFIEDVILGLENDGAIVIPTFDFLRANNNKVYMEILKERLFDSTINNLRSEIFGILEDVRFSSINFPVVIKLAAGAMSRGVFLAHNEKEFTRIIKKHCKTSILKDFIKEKVRTKIHQGYIKDSHYRNKFIIQQYVPGLTSDYKILVFGNRYYIFQRPTRENDFRASGSGNKNYIYGSEVKCPDGIFDFAMKVFEEAGVPHLSLDIAYDGHQFYLIEYQAVYFGTVGQAKADGYYMLVNGSWGFQQKTPCLEEVYVDSIVEYIRGVLI